MQRVILRTLGDHRLLGKMTDAIETLAINVKCILLRFYSSTLFSHRATHKEIFNVYRQNRTGL